jgi:hypothetical protein
LTVTQQRFEHATSRLADYLFLLLHVMDARHNDCIDEAVAGLNFLF